MFEPHDSEIAGEGNDQVAAEGSSDGNPYNDIIQQTYVESQMENWRQQAAEISESAGILAGGDGSARKKKGVINRAYVLASTASVKLRWSTGKTGRRRTSKSCVRRERGLGHGIGKKQHSS
jgi:hypothetical protein